MDYENKTCTCNKGRIAIDNSLSHEAEETGNLISFNTTDAEVSELAPWRKLLSKIIHK